MNQSYDELFSDLKTTAVACFYARRMRDLYDMLALDIDLEPVEKLYTHRLGQIMDTFEPPAEMVMTVEIAARHLEDAFDRAGRKALAGEGEE